MRNFDNHSNTDRNFNEYYNNQEDNRFYNNYSSNSNDYNRNNDYSVNNSNYRNDYYNNNGTYHNDYNSNYNMSNNAYGNYKNDYYNNNRSNYNSNDINNLYDYQTENPNRVYINDSKKLSLSAKIFLIVFISIIGLSLISAFINNFELSFFVSKLCTIMFFLMFAVISISPIITGTLKRRRCKYQNEATIIDVRVKRTNKGGRIYIPTYQYFYRDKEYIVTTRNRSGFLRPRVGDMVEVLINEDKPEDYYIGNRKSEIISLILGIIFLIIPISTYIIQEITMANFFNVY